MRKYLLSLIAVLSTLTQFLSDASAASAVPVPINNRLTDHPQLQNEEQCFISPVDTNVIIAIWRDFRLGYRQVAVGRSIDGGVSWDVQLIDPAQQMLPSTSRQTDPALSVDREGNFVMANMDFAGLGQSTIAFYRSIDSGLTWSGPYPNQEYGLFFEDKQFITIDRTAGLHDGNVYMCWTHVPQTSTGAFLPFKILFQRSLDGGQTFDAPIEVGSPQAYEGCGATLSPAGQFSVPAVDANGGVHVFWIGERFDPDNGCQTAYEIRQVTSTDGGQTFTAPKKLLDVSGWMEAGGAVQVYSQPVTDADIFGGPFNGRMYMAFTNIGPEDVNRNDVDLMVSDDNGATWGPRQTVNDFADSDQTDSFHPWLVVNQEGVVAMIFYDNRDDPPLHTSFHLYAAYSFDGGATVSTNHRITTAASDPGFLGSPLARDGVDDAPAGDGDSLTAPLNDVQAGVLGEYIGLSMQWDKLAAVWTDSRDLNSEVYNANWYLPLLEPRLLLPTHQAFVQPDPQLRWATSWKNTDDQYRVEVSTDASFATLESSAVVDTPFVDATGLVEGEYFWRAKTFKISDMDSSEYSAVFSFTVDATPPSVPALLLPPDGTSDIEASPFFDWEDAADALSSVAYELQVSTDPAFTPGPATTVVPELTVSEYSGLDPLPDSVPVYWRVITSDEAGNESVTGAFIYTHVLNCCETPGDADASGAFNIADVTFGIGRIFGGGPPSACCPEMDADGSGAFNIADVTYGIAHIFGGGPAPVCGPHDAGC